MLDRKEIFKRLRGNKSSETEDEFIPEDPFDIFYNSPCSLKNESLIKLENTSNLDNKHVSTQKKEISTHLESSPIPVITCSNIKVSDSEILSFLTRRTNQEVTIRKIEPQCIYSAQIYTSHNLSLEPIPMYKFPFSRNIKFEKSELFNLTYKAFISGLIFLYKSKDKDFIVFYKSEVLIFKKNILKITKGLIKILRSNDIEFIEEYEFLQVTDINISLVIDFLLNEEINELYRIPLIISRNKFVNGMYYEIRLIKDPKIVYENGENMFLYTLEGPLYSEEFTEYLNHKHVKIINE